MKVSMFKKQITMFTLVLALALAIYLNWNFAKSSGEADIVSDALAAQSDSVEEPPQGYYGEAMFVSSDADYVTDYFSQARLTRERSRDEALDTLEKSLESTDLTKAQKDSLTQQLKEEAGNISLETSIENQVKAKGFTDCVAFCTNGKVKVVVKPGEGELGAQQVSQIKDIVLSTCEIDVKNISVVDIK